MLIKDIKKDIKDIVVGERRREDLGDVTALAKSIQRYGLIQPIVVDAAMNLVAGERRLLACLSLGWERIEVQQLGDLSMQELRLLELEENIRRKALTSYEQSKAMTVYAGAVTKELEETGLMGDSPINPQGGRPKKAASQEKVAERVGTSRRAISEAQAHVETADAFPFMQSWPKYRVLEAREQVAEIPVDEHSRIATLLDQPGIQPTEGISIIRNLATKPQEEREGIYALNESKDPYHRQQALAAAVAKPPMPDPRLPHLRQAMKELATVSKLSNDDLKDLFTTEIGHLILLEDKIKEAGALRLSKPVEAFPGGKVAHRTQGISWGTAWPASRGAGPTMAEKQLEPGG